MRIKRTSWNRQSLPFQYITHSFSFSFSLFVFFFILLSLYFEDEFTEFLTYLLFFSLAGVFFSVSFWPFIGTSKSYGKSYTILLLTLLLSLTESSFSAPSFLNFIFVTFSTIVWILLLNGSYCKIKPFYMHKSAFSYSEIISSFSCNNGSQLSSFLFKIDNNRVDSSFSFLFSWIKAELFLTKLLISVMMTWESSLMVVGSSGWGNDADSFLVFLMALLLKLIRSVICRIDFK